MSNIQIGVAILGFGTVGRGVYELLSEQGTIRAKHGVSFDIRKILVRTPTAEKLKGIPADKVVSNIDQVVSDPSVDVVIEVIGGIEPANEYVARALAAGKHVVTANKKLMAAEGDKLIALARESGRYLGFAAAITGCHQLGRSIVSSVLVKSLVGIFNGTSNYILTRMEDGGLSFEEALREAQSRGYAEANPTDDIDGHDTCNKLVLISQLAFGVFLDVKQIPVEGIRHIARCDIEFAKQLGYSVKLVGLSRVTEEGRIEARVQPCFIPRNNLLASVKGADNGIEVHDAVSDVHGMIAVGAGARATSMAILRDLISVAQEDKIIWPASRPADQPLRYVNTQTTIGKYYVRLNVDNHPGVLANVAQVFGRHAINIASVLQPQSDGEAALLIIMCGPCEERQLMEALGEMEAFAAVKAKPFFVRVEDQIHGQTAAAAIEST
jgi:homoserine dehydrogenase